MKVSKVDNHVLRLTLEKMVIGLEEPVLVKGIGEIIAKVDSGNGGYNVIHGEDLTQQGDILVFLTVNKDGDERRVSKKIKTFIDVNIGGGHIQHRPVVELDVQIGGKDYKKIPFSVTNRKDNDNKILISKDFVGKELEALIDVTKKKIADDNVEVEYVSEGVAGAVVKGTGKAVAGTAKGAGKAVKGVAKGVLTLGKDENAAWIFGEPAGKAKSSKNDDKTKKEIKSINDLDKIQKTDAELIKQQVKTSTKEFESTDCKLDSCAPSKILDYLGNGPDPSVTYPPEMKEKMKKVLKSVKKAEEKAAKEGKKETLNKESFSLRYLFEDDGNTTATPAAAGANAGTTTPGANPNLPPVPPANNDANKDGEKQDPNKQAEEEKKDPDELSDEEFDALIEEIIKRDKAIFYVACLKTANDGTELAIGPTLWESFKPEIDSTCKEIVNGKKYDAAAFQKPSVKLAQIFTNNTKEIKTAGCFALCTGEIDSRKCELFKSPECIFNSYKKAAAADPEKATKAKESIDKAKNAAGITKNLTDESLREAIKAEIDNVLNQLRGIADSDAGIKNAVGDDGFTPEKLEATLKTLKELQNEIKNADKNAAVPSQGTEQQTK